VIAFESRLPGAASDLYLYVIATNRIFQVTATPTLNESLNDLTILPNGDVRVVWDRDDELIAHNVYGVTIQIGQSLYLNHPTSPVPAFADGVDPNEGTASTPFTFKTVYTSSGNTGPWGSYMRVCIDNICHDMTPDASADAALQDGNYVNGEQYTLTTTLAPGRHNYYFIATDNVFWARLPAAGALELIWVSDLTFSFQTCSNYSYGGCTPLTASGGTEPYTWGGSGFPPGLSINPTTGRLSNSGVAPGIYTITISVTDANGYVFTREITVTATDTTAPVVSAPPDITLTVSAGTSTPLSAFGTATAVDNVDGPLTPNADQPGPFPPGSYSITWSATDAAGNTGTAIQQVTINVRQQQLTVTKAGTGQGTITSTPAGIDCGATCESVFADGSEVRLEAQAAPGSVFSGWGGACTGTGICTVIVDAAKSVTAEFAVAAPNVRVALWAADSMGLPMPTPTLHNGDSMVMTVALYNDAAPGDPAVGPTVTPITFTTLVPAGMNISLPTSGYGNIWNCYLHDLVDNRGLTCESNASYSLAPGEATYFATIVSVTSNAVAPGDSATFTPTTSVSTWFDANPTDNLAQLPITVVGPPGTPTPAGQNVTVQPTDTAGTPQPITLMFTSVTVAGGTTAVPIANGPKLPSNFKINGSMYEITTTAQFTAPVTVCFTGIFGLADWIMHLENGIWVKLPGQQRLPAGDPPYTSICAQTQTLSPFAVATELNSPPSASAGVAQVVEATSPAGALVMLNGSGSDPDGDPLAFSWSGPCGSATTATAAFTCPLGTSTMTLTVDDGKGGSATASVDITVRDTSPPAIACNAPATIHPSDHPVSFRATATDDCGPDVQVQITKWRSYIIKRKGEKDRSHETDVNIDGDTITILESGGVGTYIEWTVSAVDGNGIAATKTCRLQTVKKPKRRGK